MWFLVCTLFGCIKKAPPLGFGPGNARARSGSEMGFKFQGCLIKTEVAVLLGVW